MEKPACLFGASFRLEREEKGISFWDAVYRAAYYSANIKRIEDGKLQPRIQLAFQLLDAIGVEPGGFMAALASEHATLSPQSLSGMSKVVVEYVIPVLQEGKNPSLVPFSRRRDSLEQFHRRQCQGCEVQPAEYEYS